MTAPVLDIEGTPYTLPSSAASLPGLTPAHVKHLLSLADDAGVDPKSVEPSALARAGSRFGIDFAVYSVAATLSRVASFKGFDAERIAKALSEANDIEDVLAALELVKARNPRIFTAKQPGAPEAPAVP